jgi:hypothetical protein
MRSSTETLIAALGVIERDIQDPQGTTVATILEARDRLSTALLLLRETRTHIPTPRRHDTPYGRYVLAVHQFVDNPPNPQGSPGEAPVHPAVGRESISGDKP